MKRAMTLALGVVLLTGSGAGGVRAAAIPQQHIKKHLRVDGSSDLRGTVRARSGLHVTDGISTDSLEATGPVQFRGAVIVAGPISANGGVNGGASPIVTAGTLQGGLLAIAGNAQISGGLSVSQQLVAAAVNDAGDLHVGGNLTGNAASFGGPLTSAGLTVNGNLTAGSVSSNGPISGSSGTFAHLSLAPGGTVNFNNAQISGFSALSGNASLTSLSVTTPAVGGSGRAPAITVTQGGQAAALSVDSNGLLTVQGAGLSVSSLSVSNNVTVNGSLGVGAGGDLLLNSTSGNNAPHLLGNHDTRGVCGANGNPGGRATCTVTFANAYPSAPTVVVTPANVDPGTVTGFSVRASTTGFVITFIATTGATVTFNYIVEG